MTTPHRPRVAVVVALFCLVWVVGASRALAQPRSARIALVVANQEYIQQGARLTNTHRDGDLVKGALEKVGFKVTVVRDTPNEGALLAAIAAHVARLSAAGPDAVGFFYYSGHGAADRPNGDNYLIPTTAPLTHVNQLPLLAVRLERITEALSKAGRMSFVVFDACRNVPLERDDKSLVFKGFAPVREQSGLLVAFATEPGNVAVDQSLYAKALSEEMVRPGQEAGAVFRRVRLKVREDTKRQQSPEYIDKRDFDFQFAAAVVAPPVQPTPSVTTLSTPEKDMDDCHSVNSEIYKDAASIAPAIAACTRAIASTKFRGVQQAALYSGRGYWKHRAKDLQNALADFNRALEIDPEHFQTFDYRADLWVEMGNDERALADYEQATRIDPDYAAAYYSRGTIFEKRRDLTAARAAYERTLATPKRDRVAEWAHDNARKRLEAMKSPTKK